jgi:hypothetical protein
MLPSVSNKIFHAWRSPSKTTVTPSSWAISRLGAGGGTNQKDMLGTSFLQPADYQRNLGITFHIIVYKERKDSVYCSGWKMSAKFCQLSRKLKWIVLDVLSRLTVFATHVPNRSLGKPRCFIRCELKTQRWRGSNGRRLSFNYTVIVCTRVLVEREKRCNNSPIGQSTLFKLNEWLSQASSFNLHNVNINCFIRRISAQSSK